MDRYQRVEKPRPETAINENEIRITTQGLIRNYISYATTLLQEKRVREIVLKAMGQAISKTVAIAEIIKKRIPGLHQDTTISSTSITDVWEPIEEGLVPLEMTRHVSMISISLSTKELNNNSPGYQAPSHVDQPKQQQLPPKQVLAPINGPNEDSYGHGRGRGGGRGRGRGWGRGGYGNNKGYGNNHGYGNNQGYGKNQGYGSNQGYYGNNQYGNSQGYGNNQGYGHNQENGGWNYNWNRGGGGGGRGRGWLSRGAGYERGRGGGAGRAYGRGRGRMGGGGRGRGIQA